MLVVEGPDGAGKTTLIHTLQEKLELPLAPRVVSKDAEAMVDLRAWVDQNLMRGFQHTIFDRHRLVSETIYGPILRQEQEPGFSDFHWLRERMHLFYKLRPIIIYCLPPLKLVKHNVWQGDDNVVVQDHIEAIYSAYVSRAALDCEMNINTFIYDYTRHGTSAMIAAIERILSNHDNI